MISTELMLSTTQDPLIRNLNGKAFGAADLVNLILQRSEIIFDQRQPGKVVAAWADGDHRPALQLVERMGDALLRRAAAIILLEYREISAEIASVAPARISDIGCGYALFDLFLWQKHQCELILIDLEDSDERHFGYRPSGAAYSNLQVARQFLLDNGVGEQQITCVNPGQTDVLTTPNVDLAMSFISCGFHYPLETYLPYIEQNVRDAVILDFRARKAREGMALLAQMGEVRHLTDAAKGNAKRVVLRKQSRAPV